MEQINTRNKSYYNNIYNYNNNNFKIRTSAKHWANHLYLSKPHLVDTIILILLKRKLKITQ